MCLCESGEAEADGEGKREVVEESSTNPKSFRIDIRSIITNDVWMMTSS